MSDSEEGLITAAKVVEYLQSALADLKETNDYLSYATLIDIYLSDVTVYNDSDKALILEALADIFELNVDIVQEIGWDLPEIFLGFLNMEFDFTGSLLRDTSVVKLIMQNFEIVAKNGNPKELFIKALELIADMDFSKVSEEDRERVDRIRDVKIHTLIELLSTSLKRIKTIYPSKFLGMAIASLLKLVTRYIQYDIHARFIVRRLYSFARDYYPPSKPENYLEEHGITEEEGQKIESDENYLQRILLQSFLTNVVSCSSVIVPGEYSLELYRRLQDENKGLLPKPKGEKDGDLIGSTKDVIIRIYNLELSYDVELQDEFQNILKNSVKLFDTIDGTKSEDDKIQDLLKISVNDKIANLYNPESPTIPLSLIGIFGSYTVGSIEDNLNVPITVKEIIATTIRILSPTLLSDKFRHIGSLDTCLYWNWKTIIDAKSSDFVDIPHYQLILYLQVLVFYSSTIPDARYRLVIFTLLTRVLSLLNESISYNFIIDTLTTAPFENAKSGMVFVLKDMILRIRPSSIDGLADSLSKTKLESNNDMKVPKLPPRHYIELNSERIEDIYALIRECIDETFGDSTVSTSPLLLSYLNLLISLKGKFPSDKIQEIVTITQEKISDYETEVGSRPDTSIELISLSLETLAGNLK